MPVDTGYNESGVVLPSLFGSPGQALQSAISLQQRNKENEQQLALQKQRQQEQDEWRKLNLIQELTDLSKYQTGDDVANAVGDKLMSDIYQKYTVEAGKMSPTELQARIQKDMSGIVTGMKGMKNELALADKQMTALKAAYPNIDTGRLYNDYRKDIASRRLRGDVGGFKNEMEVDKSSISLDDPEFLAKYVKGDDTLRDMFANPKGLDDTSVFMGNPNSYTKYTAKIPPWRKPNYDPAGLKSGFLPNRNEPALDFKESTIPLGGKELPVIDKDYFDTIEGKPKIELIAQTQKMFPGYENFSPTEKEYAQRHILLKTAKAYDKTGFHPTQVHAPSASILKFYAGGGSGSSSKEPAPIDLTEYPDTPFGKNVTKLFQGVKVTGLPDGKTYLAKDVQYDPVTKRIKYTEYTTQDDDTGKYGVGVEKEASLTKFFQDIKTNNPGIDMKFLEGLEKPILGNKPEPKKEQPAVKKITVKGL